jgi:hypothetical protein
LSDWWDYSKAEKSAVNSVESLAVWMAVQRVGKKAERKGTSLGGKHAFESLLMHEERDRHIPHRT